MSSKLRYPLTFHIVWSIVYYELKYDKSIGTKEDKELVAGLIEELAAANIKK